ncbi:BTAD domain-containing putative transcriptional regulator [Nakamurella leprariae]|uniref:Winged helix-turn-helix domain-containing protein n=1 Tax=Nakamurella leprariae TaxID=2803911 RepID=A0A938YG33_9ACTN|nr:BTAD domain-containing putative transcriptional regulator [Nakamurella leprariae]MBM9467489.1 winged helix-turn-helix domain-containing protein [Nakamurella leprariae]
MPAGQDPPRPRFRDLGPLVVDVDGRSRSPGGVRLTAALALLLVHAGRRVSADALRDAVWGPAAAGRAPSTLETHMFRLRRVVEPARAAGQPPSVLLSDTGGYRLAVTTDEVDSLRFLALAGEATGLLRDGQPERALRRCEQAQELWRGRPFEPHTDQDWAAAAVARLDETHVQLRELAVQTLLDCGRPEQALLEADAVLAGTPLRERVWRDRMLAAYRCGRVDEALDSYRRARRLLRDELGVEPGAELRDLHAAILAGDDRVPAAPRGASRRDPAAVTVRLPRRRGSLIGRERALEDLRELCSTRTVITVTGAAGCGKTRLAVETAARCASEFVDGIHFVDLTTVDDPDTADPALDIRADPGADTGADTGVDSVADTVISTLGLAPSAAGAVATLRTFLRRRRMLLVLDNCEHVVDAAAGLLDALQGTGSETTILATSREPLRVGGEAVFPLEPLALPSVQDQADGLVDLAEAPAIRLFLDRVGSHPIGEQQLPLVAEICRAVDGVPLAVELAAARVGAYSLEEIARQVTADLGALQQTRRGVPGHQQSLQRTVEWSHRMLSASEQLVHRRVATIAGAFTTTAAARVSGVDPAGVADLLAGLVDKSMLVPLGPLRDDGPSQFSQLATVRAHARRALSDAHETTAAARRRDGWVTALVEAKPPLGHPDERRWFNELDDDLASIRATLHDAVQTSDAAACLIAGRLTMYWYHRGLVPEGARWAELARHINTASALDQALATLCAAGGQALAGRLDLAVPLIQEALLIRSDRTRDEDIAFAEALLQTAGGVQLAGDQAVSASLARRALRIADDHQDPSLALIARARLALDPSGPTATDAEAIYGAAMHAGNHYAAYLAASGAVLRAALRQDSSTGLAWSDRILALHRRQDIAQAPVVLEIRANLMTMAGRVQEAVRLYSAAQVHNSRAGLPWPSRDFTAALLARATEQLDRTRFQDAWDSGRALTLDQVELVTSGEADRPVAEPMVTEPGLA